jgi:uncharacterized protein (TIGR00661 family)
MKVLFSLSGLGLGNSTRCHAVMQRLKRKGATIEAITSANGLWYFSDKPEVEKTHAIETFHYGSKDGKISIGRTLASVGGMAQTLLANARIVNKILDTFQPDVVVADSDYVFRPMRKRRIPIVALNNADLVCRNYRRFGDAPSNVVPQYYCIESMDALYHRTIPDVVVSPTLGGIVPEDKGRIKHTGPIVRENYRVPDNAPLEDRAVIMLSGSNFGTNVTIGSSPLPMAIDIVGRDQPENWDARENVTFHGKTKNTYPLLSSAKVVVVNGGYSAVSEVVCMKKMAVIVPVPCHAEQWSNAREIQNLGIGLVSDEQSYITAMQKIYGNGDVFKAAYDKMPPIRDGAEEAADIIFSAAG